MIIGSSMVSMQSQRTYSTVDVKQYAQFVSDARSETSPNSTDANELPTPEQKDTNEAPAYDAFLLLRKPIAEGGDQTVIHSMAELRMFLLEQLTRSLSEGRWLRTSEGELQPTRENFSCGGNFANRQIPPGEYEIRLPAMYTVRTVQSYYHAEREVTEFASQGQVRTADGREINFGVHFQMDRRFETYEEQDEQITVFCDPLVINFKGDVTKLADQYFEMDLDGDGTAEKLKQLAEGSGFLALDRNEDGIINDGSELFGTKSGNGFKDLAAYDSDGNGWIDEADEIFDKLKLLVKDQDGNDSLLTLKEAGIGAISLDSVRTEFALKDENNDTEAVIRRSGIFLYENGTVGTVQQMDYAV